MKKQIFQLRLTIGTKLIGLIALLLASSVATLVYLSTEMYVRNDRENIRVSNVETTGNLANQTREIFSDLAEKMHFFGTILFQDNAASAAHNPVLKSFFEKDKDFLGVVVQKREQNDTLGVVSFAFSKDMAAIGDPGGTKAISSLTGNRAFSATHLLKGDVQIVPLKLADGSSGIAVSIPLVQSESDPNTFSYTATAFIRPTKFSKIFSENVRGSSYLVDREGIVLAHTDATRVGENFSNLAVVKEFLTGSKPQNLVPYVDPVSKEARLASYRVVGFAGLGVVAEVPEGLAYQAANTMGHRSVLVGLIILFIAFWAGYMYSGSITKPIQKLVEAAQRIASGDFKIDLKPKGKDEIAHLSRAFTEMAHGLEERDRVKETFNKFHNKEIAEKLLSGEVKLGGERREATVFFSDVRGFTALSETMQPEEVVEMLNEYMTCMVSIIRKYHGIVDKYVGDAIMALWGVPIGGENDLYHAVRACLEMREELAKLNTLRISRGQAALKIGMGLNIGPVIAGNIGSTEKMEYTVIGDTVNLASRVESMTKEYGADLLVPQAIYDRLQNRFIFEKCKSARVKGKSNAIDIYKVKGYVDEAGREVLIETAYSSYEIEKSDKVIHDEPAETSSVTPPPLASASEPSLQPVAEIESYYVRMFGEMMGPFTDTELRQGIRNGEFPSDAAVSKTQDGEWTPISQFGAATHGPTPPPFRHRTSAQKTVVPPPFKKAA